jgi:hypothetical protein
VSPFRRQWPASSRTFDSCPGFFRSRSRAATQGPPYRPCLTRLRRPLATSKA